MDPTIDTKLFESIQESLEIIKRSTDQTTEAQKKIEKLSRHIEAAQDTILRAEEKRDALLRKNNFLRERLDKLNGKKADAIKYWQDYGFNVRQVPKSDDSPDSYEFIYSKLNGEELMQPITVIVKLQDKILSIVSRTPTDVLNDEVIEDLNAKLKDDCCHPGSDHVDFKLAMLRIRKALIKHPDP